MSAPKSDDEVEKANKNPILKPIPTSQKDSPTQHQELLVFKPLKRIKVLKMLGEGSQGQVALCTYKTPDGEEG